MIWKNDLNGKTLKARSNSLDIYSGKSPAHPWFLVTTSLRPTPAQTDLAKHLAVTLQAPFVKRNDFSLETLSNRFSAAGLVVVSSQRVSYISGGSEFFFHPGIAKLRIKELKSGKTDQMIAAMSLLPGDTVLDCTLGLGADAVVAGYISGACGRITGLESSPVIAALVERGLATYTDKDQDITPAMRRVKVININYKEYLASLEPCCFDVVYFDPMFRFPRRNSPSINAARSLADHAPVCREAVAIALKVATKRVVMKERRNSSEFARLGFKTIVGGRYAPVVYGVIELRGKSQ